jgi:hypothetical protein
MEQYRDKTRKCVLDVHDREAKNYRLRSHDEPQEGGQRREGATQQIDSIVVLPLTHQTNGVIVP